MILLWVRQGRQTERIDELKESVANLRRHELKESVADLRRRM